MFIPLFLPLSFYCGDCPKKNSVSCAAADLHNCLCNTLQLHTHPVIQPGLFHCLRLKVKSLSKPTRKDWQVDKGNGGTWSSITIVMVQKICI